MVSGGQPFSDGGQIIIDSIRLAYVVGATVLFILLGWRAGRWISRHREPAWLHLAAMLLCGSAAHTGFINLGEELVATFPLNTLGIFCGLMFIWRTPPESLDRWREERGNPPDWDVIFNRLDGQ